MLLLLFFGLSACAGTGPPRMYIDVDAYAYYYATDDGRILRVERDGTVLDVTCLHPPTVKGAPQADVLRQLCTDDRVQTLGKVGRQPDGSWDLSRYHIAPETGTCASLFAPFRNDWLEHKRESCWHRVWEVPAAVVLYPSIAIVAVGLLTAPIWVPLLLL